MATIADADIFDALGGIVKCVTAFLQEVLPAENSSVFLHGLLHFQSNLSSARASSRVSKHVKVGNALFTSISGQLALGLTRLLVLFSSFSASATENDQIEERVSSKSVGSMDRSTGSLTAGKQAWNYLVITLSILREDLTTPVGRNTTHVVMHGGKDGNGLLGCIDTSEDMSSLKNTWETLMDLLGWQMVQVEVNVVIIGTHTTALQDLHGHRA